MNSGIFFFLQSEHATTCTPNMNPLLSPCSHLQTLVWTRTPRWMRARYVHSEHGSTRYEARLMNTLLLLEMGLLYDKLGKTDRTQKANNIFVPTNCSKVSPHRLKVNTDEDPTSSEGYFFIVGFCLRFA